MSFCRVPRMRRSPRLLADGSFMLRNRVTSCRAACGVAVLSLALAGVGTAQSLTSGGQADSSVADPGVRAGGIVGVVVDAETRAPIAGAYVRVLEIGRNELSHADGSFHFLRLAPRAYTLVAQRIGYAPSEQRVRVVDGEPVRVVMTLSPSALELSGIVVTGTGRERGTGDTYQATTVLGDAELRRRLESSVAATVAHVPGISQRYNGPAASQPVIRGMGGDRVLVLEDGQRTGDLASTAADHAVSVEPLTARRIEIVRGPAGLLYGSNALGGVINVIREEVPRTLPETFSAGLSAQAESVNRGLSVAGAALLPLGRFALRGELSGRTAGETRTPLGVLPSTQLQGLAGSVGASWMAGWGFVGAAYRDHALEYGVPGEFNGEVIRGAHPGGVEIETRRRTGRVEAGHFAGAGPFSALTLDANVVHYQHDEIEGRIDGRTILGARFDNLSGGVNLLARHEHEADPLLVEGAIGLNATARDHRAIGTFTGSRSARTQSLAGFIYEELAFDAWRLQLGARYDWTRMTPLSLAPITVNGRSVPVRERDFGAVSGSVAALYEWSPGWTLGLSVARAFRTPSIEELYSDGPHLGDFSYDIGNPELDAEVGLGAELMLRAALPRMHLEASVFHNALRNYIHHRPTGEIDPRFRRFPVFQARGEDARFLGAEAGAQWEPMRHLVFDATGSWVRATRLDTGEPLPAIPPLNGGLRARLDRGAFFVSLGVEGALAQERVAPPIADPLGSGELLVPERPTPAYALLNAGAGLRWVRGAQLHTLTLSIDNVGDAVWRDHLSRIKDVAPQPGRNAQLLYRVQF
jgi:iron complex outermembrane recepter protein